MHHGRPSLLVDWLSLLVDWLQYWSGKELGKTVQNIMPFILEIKYVENTDTNTFFQKVSSFIWGGKPRWSIGICLKTTWHRLKAHRTVSSIPTCDMTLRILSRDIVPVAGGRVIGRVVYVIFFCFWSWVCFTLVSQGCRKSRGYILIWIDDFWEVLLSLLLGGVLNSTLLED